MRSQPQDLTIAVAIEKPSLHLIHNPNSNQVEPTLGYKARLEYRRKRAQERVILCNTLHSVAPNETVFVAYHNGMKQYQHSRCTTVSNNKNCEGGFYYLNGESAE